MSRTLIVAGVHADRPWPEAGPVIGQALREWSRTVLPHVTAAATEHGAQAILVLGDLFDRQTVTPDTIGHLAEQLAEFPGKVLIAPGATDWFEQGGPHTFARWPKNVSIWRSGRYAASKAVPGLCGSAWTEPAQAPPPIAPVGQAWARPSVPTRAWPPVPDGGLFVTSGEGLEMSDATIVVPPLVGRLQSPGRAVLMELGETVSAQVVELPPCPGAAGEVDVSGFGSTEALDAALQPLVGTGEPTWISLTGTLPSGVLLPEFAGRPLPRHVVLDVDDLEFAVAEPELGDHSVEAELHRALRQVKGTPLELHQTAALGTRALAREAAQARREPEL